MICQDCGQTFADKRKLAVHSQNHAKDEKKCHICEKICIGNKKFLNHKKLHQLHYLCTQNELGDYQLILHDFRTNFNYLYDEFRLPMTLKIHVIYDHYVYFL